MVRYLTPGGKTSTHTDRSINQISKLLEIVTVSHDGAWREEIEVELSYKLLEVKNGLP